MELIIEEQIKRTTTVMALVTKTEHEHIRINAQKAMFPSVGSYIRAVALNAEITRSKTAPPLPYSAKKTHPLPIKFSPEEKQLLIDKQNEFGFKSIGYFIIYAAIHSQVTHHIHLDVPHFLRNDI